MQLIGWRGYALAAAIAALVAGIAVWTVQGWRYGDEISGIRAEHAELLKTQSDAARKAEQTQRGQELTWQKEKDDLQKKSGAMVLAADNRAAGAAGERDRLLGELARITRPAAARPAGAAPQPAPGGEGVRDTAALDMLVGLLDRHSGELVDVGRYAERLKIAGLICEQTYDATLGGN